MKEGESIVQPLEASRVFPPMVVSMVDVGEETGKLPEMLLKIADVYDDEVDNAVAAITSMLEPIMIVFLALIVGTIVLALFTPLISIITGLQQRNRLRRNDEARMTNADRMTNIEKAATAGGRHSASSLVRRASFACRAEAAKAGFCHFRGGAFTLPRFVVVPSPFSLDWF